MSLSSLINSLPFAVRALVGGLIVAHGCAFLVYVGYLVRGKDKPRRKRL